MRTNIERILDFLWSAGPRGATNAQIREGTGIEPPAQIYMITRDLLNRGKIRSNRSGHEWSFYILESPDQLLQSLGRVAPRVLAPRLTEREFEDLARQKFGELFHVAFLEGEAGGIPRSFALVSPEGDIVGDARSYAYAGEYHLPLAKFSTIAELVWLLENAPVKRRFLVFGHDIEVPRAWLARYNKLRGSVEFFYLDADGTITDLTPVEE